MFNTAFNRVGAKEGDYYPLALRSEIDTLNERIYDTVNMQHIKNHYYASHESINPSRVIPVGPEIDFTTHHDRARFHQEQ